MDRITSPGRPTDIGLQLGKTCYPCKQVRVEGECFISSVSSLSFLFPFLPCPSLPSPLLSILSLFSLFLGDDTKWPTRVDVSLNPNSINQVWIGAKKYSTDTIKTRWKLSWGSTQFRLLGITFNVDLSKIIEVNYNDKIRGWVNK